MPRFDIYKTLSQTGDKLRQIAILNPLTIHKKGSRAKAIFALALVCFFWGTTWIASKEGVRHMPALQLCGIRQFLGGCCYVVFFLVKGVPLPKGREWFPILIMALLNFTLSNGLSTWGVQFVSAGLGSIMGAIFPLWIVVIGLFSSGEKMPVKAITGLLIGFTGVCVIFYEHLADFLNPGFQFGIGISLVATWSWAIGTLYTKKQSFRFNPYLSLGLQMVISGAFLTILTQLVKSPTIKSAIPVAEIPWQSWAAIGYLVIFGSVISFIAYLYALQRLSTEQSSIYAYVNPIVAVFFGWLLFNEELTAFIVGGVLLALLGVYLVNKAFKGTPPVEQPETEGV